MSHPFNGLSHRWPPPPPRPHLSWTTVPEKDRAPLLSWRTQANEWLDSGSWWARRKRRRNAWVQAWHETAVARGFLGGDR